MQYRRFGRTNRLISVLSLGTMRCLSSPETFDQTISQAIALGINHIETAQGYGQSEALLGQSLVRCFDQGLTRDRLTITTKLPPNPDAAAIDRQIDQSLDRLGCSRVDCLAIHGINTPEHLAWIESSRGCMRAVRRALDDGRIAHVGFSTHGAREVIQAAIATDQFDFVNLHFGLFFQHHQPVIDLAAEKDMGIFMISPGDKGGQLYTPPPQLEQLCQPYSPLELAYRWLLSDPRITTLSVGPADSQELKEPVALADRIEPLSTAELQVLERLEAQQDTALGSDRCRQCYECLPCPEVIQIPEVLRLRNLAVAYGMEGFGKYRYGMFEKAGHWFPGRRGDRCTDCGDCLPRCPEQLDIPALLRDAHNRLKGPERRRLWD
ncbi:oxidoreductase [filamentous cyanobacterium CCP5]|nr:oxidoreductase [filamentous cyanobacterium CCP5]